MLRVLTAAVLMIAVIAWRVRAVPPALPPTLTLPVAAANFVITIESEGQLEPETEQPVTIPNQFGASQIEEILEEGAHVPKGGKIARLSTFKIEEQERNARQELIKKQAEEKRMQRDHALAAAEDAKKVQTCAEELAYNRRVLAALLKGPDRRQLDALVLKIARAQNEEHHQAARLTVQEELKSRGYLSELDYDAIATDLTKSRLDLAKQENLVALQKEGPRHEERERARALVDKFARDLELATRAAASQTTLRKLALDKKDAEIRDRAAAVEDKARQRQRAMLRSPLAGTVLYASGSVFGGPMGVGAPVYGGMSLARIVERGRMRARVQVNERWIDRIKIGQPAVVASAHRLGQAAAHVIAIARLAQQREDGPKSPRDFAVTLELDRDTPTLRPNMSCTAAIEVARLARVARVPLDYIVRREGKTVHLLVDRGGASEPITATLVDSGPEYVYVSGLVGEKLVFP